MNRDKIFEFLEHQGEEELIDLMKAYLSKVSIIDLMKTWEDDVLEEAAENLGYNPKLN
jgi:hypothetical protein